MDITLSLAGDLFIKVLMKRTRLLNLLLLRPFHKSLHYMGVKNQYEVKLLLFFSIY